MFPKDTINDKPEFVQIMDLRDKPLAKTMTA